MANGCGANSGSDEQRITATIEATRDFFERMGVPTHMSAYNLDNDAIDLVINQLKAHGMTQLGEQSDVTPEVSRRILIAAL